MKILVDADACPVKKETVVEADKRGISVVFVSNFHHQMPETPGVEVVVVGDDPDETDLRIANDAVSGDVVVTQDYPLAALVLSKGSRALSPRGLIYTDDNIVPLLEERHRTLSRIRQGKRPKKGPKPFRALDRQRFRDALVRLLEDGAQGGEDMQ